jgi:hypothetical protein
MHFWNIDALADELKTGKLSEVQAFKYFLVVLLLQSGPYFLPIRNEGALTFYSMGFGSVIPFVWFASGVAGLILCFRANQQADGKDFIQRLICLELPSLIRTIVFCIPFLFIGALVGRALLPGDSHDVALWVVGFYILLMIIVQLRMIYRRLEARPISSAGTDPS